METVTFNHFSDVWVGVPLVMSFMNHNVWLGEHYGCCLRCSLAVGVEYEMLQFLVVEQARCHVKIGPPRFGAPRAPKF